VRRPGATRQRIHCRARGARQRTSARQRALEAHGKDPCTALSFFPVVTACIPYVDGMVCQLGVSIS
jgi:hypothetical protein